MSAAAPTLARPPRLPQPRRGVRRRTSLFAGGEYQAGVTAFGFNRIFGRMALVYGPTGLGTLATLGVRL